MLIFGGVKLFEFKKGGGMMGEFMYNYGIIFRNEKEM